MTQAAAQLAVDDTWVPTHCSMCYHGCPILVHRVNGVAVKIEGHPLCPATQGAACPKGNAGIMKLYDPHRVKTPLKRTNPEKGVGVDPGWVAITWDEARAILVERLKRIRETDPRKLAVGGFNPHSWYWGFAFGTAFGTPNANATLLFSSMGHMCGSGAHTAGLMTHGSMNTHPDVEYARYMMIVGGAAMEAYQSAVAYARLFGDAKQRGVKLVVVDPQQSRAAAKADEWVPIRPATDGALLFGMMHTLLLELKLYDAEYLKRYTNAAYLIGADQYPVRDPRTKKALVWDAVDGVAKPHDDPSIKDYALEGTYETPGGMGRPAFELFKEQIRPYTPEWAAEITSVPAATIRRLAQELGEAAQIGSTITIDGNQYPYRPASVAGYRGLGAHTNGLHSSWAMEMINLLIGATRAVGGARAWMSAHVPEAPAHLQPGPDGVVNHAHGEPELAYPPQTVTLMEYFPASFTPGLACYEAQLEPEKFNVTPIDTLIFECGNPVLTGQNPSRVIKGLTQIPFLVDITIYLDETAEFADLILPDATYLERWSVEGNWSIEDEGIMIQRPVVEPLYETRHSADVFIELARDLGILTGANGMSAILGMLHGGPAYDPDKHYRSAGEYVEDYVACFGGSDQERIWREGHNLRRIPVPKRYLPTCLNGYRLPFYNMWLMKTGDRLKALLAKHDAFREIGLDERIFFEYAPLPFWHPSVLVEEPPEFDLYVINWRTSIAVVGNGTVPASNAWLMEIAERDPYATRILLNAATATRKGLEDGTMVWVESPHGKIKGRLKVTETIHPEVIGTIGCAGHYTPHAVGRGKGPGNFNSLLGSGFRYMGPTSLQTECAARAKIYAV